MTGLELVPDVTDDQIVWLLGLLAIALLFAVGMVVLEHLATEWTADQYEAGQSPTEGLITPRDHQPRIPAQRRPDHDTEGDLS